MSLFPKKVEYPFKYAHVRITRVLKNMNKSWEELYFRTNFSFNIQWPTSDGNQFLYLYTRTPTHDVSSQCHQQMHFQWFEFRGQSGSFTHNLVCSLWSTM